MTIDQFWDRVLTMIQEEGEAKMLPDFSIETHRYTPLKKQTVFLRFEIEIPEKADDA